MEVVHIKESSLVRFRRVRLRTLIICIALLAAALAPLTLFLRFYARVKGFYGPDGVLGRKYAATESLTAGDRALGEGRYAAAETQYRSALALMTSLPEPDGGHDTSAALLGLANALAKQNLLDEAEPLYRAALDVRLALRRKLRGTPPFADEYPWHSWIRQASDPYASFLRTRGRPGEAMALEQTVEAEFAQAPR